MTSIIAPATTITAIEAPTVRLEATLQTMVAESVPADALSLEQLALMLEALELKSAGGKKHTASAAAGEFTIADLIITHTLCVFNFVAMTSSWCILRLERNTQTA